MPTAASLDDVKLHHDIRTAQAALDELKRTLGAEPVEALPQYASGHARRDFYGERRVVASPGRAIRFTAVMKAAAVIAVLGTGGWCWKLQLDADAMALAQAQIQMSSQTCQRIYRAAGVVSPETAACLAAAHLVEGGSNRPAGVGSRASALRPDAGLSRPRPSPSPTVGTRRRLALGFRDG